MSLDLLHSIHASSKSMGLDRAMPFMMLPVTIRSFPTCSSFKRTMCFAPRNQTRESFRVSPTSACLEQIHSLTLTMTVRLQSTSKPKPPLFGLLFFLCGILRSCTIHSITVDSCRRTSWILNVVPRQIKEQWLDWDRL